MTFGEKLKSLRESRYLTQQKLADDLQISQSSVAAYERGIREPSFAIIETLANYFHVPFSSLTPSSDTIDDDYVQRVAETLHQNPKLKLLFDHTQNFNEKDLDAMIAIAESILGKRE